MQNLGIILPHLGSSQAAYEAIKLASSVENAILFFEQLTPAVVKIPCSTMCISEVMNFGGLLVTTNIENTIMAHRVVNRKRTKLVFYVWDLEWLRPGKQNYLYNINAYAIPDVLVVRSEHHVGPICNYSNRTPLVREFSQVIQC